MLFFLFPHRLEICEWKGQNQRTLSVGWFPSMFAAHALTAAAPASGPTPTRSWATPERIDE